VPGDGNCFFHAVSYQLPNIGIQPIDAVTLRIMVVNHLEANETNYIDFIQLNNNNDDITLEWEKFLFNLSSGRQYSHTRAK
jgi:hypothetical protein